MKVKKYIKKTIPIEAFIWKGYNEEDWEQVEEFVEAVPNLEAYVDKQYGGLRIVSESLGGDCEEYAHIGSYVVKVGCNEHEADYCHIETYSPEAFKLLYRAKYSEGEV